AARARELVGSQRVGAHQLGELVGVVDRCLAHRPHFVEVHLHAQVRGLPRSFGSREAPADHHDALRHDMHLLAATVALVAIAVYRDAASARTGAMETTGARRTAAAAAVTALRMSPGRKGTAPAMMAACQLIPVTRANWRTPRP